MVTELHGQPSVDGVRALDHSRHQPVRDADGRWWQCRAAWQRLPAFTPRDDSKANHQAPIGMEPVKSDV
jgi:hypothetical protein